MCEHGKTIPVIVTHKTYNSKRWADIDECIAPIVKALNNCDIQTVASCCGHGNKPGNIILKDGRELIIAPDYETARKIDSYFPDIHGD